MKFKKGDRILFSRMRFGTVYQNQTDAAVVHVVLDKEPNIIHSVRYDAVELVADARHEAALADQINGPWKPTGTVAGEGLKRDHAAELKDLAAELDAAAFNESNYFRLAIIMRTVATKLQSIAKEL